MNYDPAFSFGNLFGSLPQPVTSGLTTGNLNTPPTRVVPPAVVNGGGFNLSNLAALFGGNGGGTIGAQPRRNLNISGVESNSNTTSNEDWARMFNNTGVMGGTMQSSVTSMDPRNAMLAAMASAKQPIVGDATNRMAMERARGGYLPPVSNLPLGTTNLPASNVVGSGPSGIYMNGKKQPLMALW